MDLFLDDLDWKKILIRRYKIYQLKEADLAVLLLINELNKGAPHLVQADELETYMSISAKEIDSCLSRIVKLGYAVVVDGSYFSVDPLKKKILKDSIKEIKQNDEVGGEKSKEDTSALYRLVERAIGRNLSSLEFDQVTNWLKYSLSLKADITPLIEDLLKKKGRTTVAAINKEIKIMIMRRKEESVPPLSDEMKKILTTPIYGHTNE